MHSLVQKVFTPEAVIGILQNQDLQNSRQKRLSIPYDNELVNFSNLISEAKNETYGSMSLRIIGGHHHGKQFSLKPFEKCLVLSRPDLLSPGIIHLESDQKKDLNFSYAATIPSSTNKRNYYFVSFHESGQLMINVYGNTSKSILLMMMTDYIGLFAPCFDPFIKHHVRESLYEKSGIESLNERFDIPSSFNRDILKFRSLVNQFHEDTFKFDEDLSWYAYKVVCEEIFQAILETKRYSAHKFGSILQKLKYQD